MEPFFRKFCSTYGLSEEIGGQLAVRMEPRRFRKGECLVRQGERNTDFHIVANGIWLGRYLCDATDISVWFAGEGEALLSTCGYVRNQPSMLTIEAMCDSTVYRISKPAIEEFFATSVEAANFGRRIFEQQFLGLETWILNGSQRQAEERYLALLAGNPELLRHVPLKHIASYLWITPQSLSRIRARINRRKR